MVSSIAVVPITIKNLQKFAKCVWISNFFQDVSSTERENYQSNRIFRFFLINKNNWVSNQIYIICRPQF